jgi:hypothetical protein
MKTTTSFEIGLRDVHAQKLFNRARSTNSMGLSWGVAGSPLASAPSHGVDCDLSPYHGSFRPGDVAVEQVRVLKFVPAESPGEGVLRRIPTAFRAAQLLQQWYAGLRTCWAIRHIGLSFSFGLRLLPSGGRQSVGLSDNWWQPLRDGRRNTQCSR